MAIAGMTLRFPDELSAEVEAALGEWHEADKVRRLWQGDATLWTGNDEADWLGWLQIPREQGDHLEALSTFAHEVESEGYSDALLLGMGGSSLGPEVLSLAFGRQPRHLRLHVLDSTDPGQVRSFAQRVDLSRTIFIVSSKSGTTLEPNVLLQFFFDRMRRMVGAEAGSRFVAITDPGSKLEKVAGDLGFLHIFHGVPSIGGRFSVLSHFGLVPAAAMGLDVEKLLAGAVKMAEDCGAETTPAQNPGAVLGAVLGTAARLGRDKVTLVASPQIGDLGAWLEQLLAESTGKQGKALVPIDDEPLVGADLYGDDRLFVYIRLDTAPDPEQDAAVDRIEQAGQPLVRISLADPYALGKEFFRWQFATAVAASLMEVNPFDQPDVEASKIVTRRLTSAYEITGSLPREPPFAAAEGLALYADTANAAALQDAVGERGGIADYLRAHLERSRPGDYFALLAFLEASDAHREQLQAIRRAVLEAKGVATCLGFGPRFLHSTGQAYKGGPNKGVFLQLTCDDREDLPVPDRQYSFGVVKAAQARGDFEVLAERRRRALRVHLGTDTVAGLVRLRQIISEAVG